MSAVVVGPPEVGKSTFILSLAQFNLKVTELGMHEDIEGTPDIIIYVIDALSDLSELCEMMECYYCPKSSSLIVFNKCDRPGVSVVHNWLEDNGWWFNDCDVIAYSSTGALVRDAQLSGKNELGPDVIKTMYNKNHAVFDDDRKHIDLRDYPMDPSLEEYIDDCMGNLREWIKGAIVTEGPPSV